MPPGTDRFGHTDNRKGALYMIAAGAVFVTMTILVKFLGEAYSAGVQTFFRQTAGLVVMLPVILIKGRGVLATRRPVTLIFRAAMSVFGLMASFYAYQKLPLSTANALSFTRILWVLLLAAIFLGEKLTLSKIAATVIGFFGVLVMLDLGRDIPEPAAAAAGLGAAAMFAAAIVGMKSMSEDHHALTLIAWAAILGFGFSLPGALLSWTTPTWADAALLALMGGLGLLNQTLFIRGMQLGEAGLMAPLDYLRLPLATGAGLLLFGETLNLRIVAGAIVIVFATAVAQMSERWIRRASDPEA